MALSRCPPPSLSPTNGKGGGGGVRKEGVKYESEMYGISYVRISFSFNKKGIKKS